MTPNEMAEIGSALYGDRWQTALSNDLHVADRTMRRWLASASSIPENVGLELRELLVTRLQQIGGIIGYTVNKVEGIIFHHPSAACFRYDRTGNLSLLNPQVLADTNIRLVTQGAMEALRREADRDPDLKFSWGNQEPKADAVERQVAIHIPEALQFAQELSDAAIDVVGASHIELNAKGARDPRVVAISILCRTISNFRAAMLLVQQESVLEARALTRLIYENLLWIGSLSARGDAFVQDMLADEAHNRHALGQLTLHLSAKHGGDSNSGDALNLRNLISEVSKSFPNKKKLNAKKAASDSVVELAYVEYSRLSLDAVHCSITALGRHLESKQTTERTELTISVVPRASEAEVLETILHACNGLIGVTVGADELIGRTSASQRIKELFEELERRGWHK